VSVAFRLKEWHAVWLNAVSVCHAQLCRGDSGVLRMAGWHRRHVMCSWVAMCRARLGGYSVLFSACSGGVLHVAGRRWRWPIMCEWVTTMDVAVCCLAESRGGVGGDGGDGGWCPLSLWL